MATTLESWNTMSQLQHARRRAITAGAVIAAVLVVAALAVVKLWPDSGSPSRDAAKGSDLTWQATPTGIEVPISRSAGPHSQVAGLTSGFSRTELGAALAALHIAGRAAGSFGPAIFEPTIRNQVVGENAEAMLARVTRDYQEQRQKLGLAEGQAIPSSGGEVLGYKIEEFSTDRAVVTTISGFGAKAEKFFGLRLEVLWQNADWRLVAPPDGSIANVFQEFSEIPADARLFPRKS
jgi:hypothetical protein